jgi:hypothetical protein
MTDTTASTDWTTLNQALLVAELARIKAILVGDGDGVAEADGRIRQCREALEDPAAIDHISSAFALSPFERDLLLLTAGVELDGAIGGLCAAAAAGSQRPWGSFALALALLPDPHWSALTPGGPLRRWRLIETIDDGALVSSRLRIDERVLHYLAGVNDLDPRLAPLLRSLPPTSVMAPSQRSIAKATAAELGRQGSPLPLLQLLGDDADGKRDTAVAMAAALGLRMYALTAAEIPANPQERDALARLWERETTLLEAALLVEAADAAQGQAALPFLERVAGLTLVSCPIALACQRPDRRLRIDQPLQAEQPGLWQLCLGPAANGLMAELEDVTSEFRLSAREIRRLGVELSCVSGAEPAERVAALRRACRGEGQLQLGGLAQRIEPAAGWDDLILPAAQNATLRQIASQVRHRLTVHEHWGFAAKGSRGLGITVLFAGESGTGKTMAAEVLARELQMDLVRIDLAAVVSKYIGETEKNLARVFDAAEDSGTILLFDEADALFGKRSEVKDSHDRFANIEVSYLLQRMEAYRGLAILTTNQRSALDPAFQRRLRFVVTFPFPDVEQREAIWRGVFPADAPLRDIDAGKLARLQMAGGHIRNIALTGAFLAAESGEPIDMEKLLLAAHCEAGKRDRPLADAETRGWIP